VSAARPGWGRHPVGAAAVSWSGVLSRPTPRPLFRLLSLLSATPSSPFRGPEGSAEKNEKRRKSPTRSRPKRHPSPRRGTGKSPRWLTPASLKTQRRKGRRRSFRCALSSPCSPCPPCEHCPYSSSHRNPENAHTEHTEYTEGDGKIPEMTHARFAQDAKTQRTREVLQVCIRLSGSSVFSVVSSASQVGRRWPAATPPGLTSFLRPEPRVRHPGLMAGIPPG
jgi:hypothetical protein